MIFLLFIQPLEYRYHINDISIITIQPLEYRGVGVIKKHSLLLIHTNYHNSPVNIIANQYINTISQTDLSDLYILIYFCISFFRLVHRRPDSGTGNRITYKR